MLNADNAFRDFWKKSLVYLYKHIKFTIVEFLYLESQSAEIYLLEMLDITNLKASVTISHSSLTAIYIHSFHNLDR